MMEMRKDTLQEIVSSLMESPFYFDLNVKERLNLVAHVIRMMHNGPSVEQTKKTACQSSGKHLW
jgi:hypothetical protein